jgi:hypothetical protein
VRALFLILLACNLLFLAWARWIDAPRDPATQTDRLSRLPRLQLVTDSPPGPKPTADHPVQDDSLPPVQQQKTSVQLPDLKQSCTSVGPFNDIASAARAAGLLTQRGFTLQQRAEEGETIEGYWVFVSGLQSDDEVTRLVARLEKSGFSDAHVMKNYSTNRRVSVGMFSSRERAEKRAAAVRNIGLEPEIGERKFPGTVYWVDVDLKRGLGFKQLPPEYSFTDVGYAKVQMQPCPAAPRSTEGLSRTTVASAPKVIP